MAAASGSKLATGWLELTVSTKGAEKQIVDQVSNAGTKAGSGFGSKLIGGLTKVGIGAAAVAGGVLATSLVKGFSRLTAIDDAQAKLRGLGQTTQGISTIMGSALASVKGTAFGLADAATVSAAAVAAGIKPGAQLTGVLKTIADTATIAGASMTDTGAIFNSVAARGKLQGDDLMQLQSRGVPVLQFLAKHYGITAQAASDMVSKGKVDFANFSAAMQENLGGAALKSGDTFRGAVANLGASLGRIGAGLLGGVFPKLAPLITAITTALAPLEAKASALGAVIGNALSPVINGLIGLLSGAGAGAGGLASAFAPVMTVFSTLGSIFAPIFTALGPLIPQLVTLYTSLSPVSLIMKAIQGVLPQLMAAFSQLATVLGGALGQALAVIVPVVSNLAGVVAGALGQALTAVVPLINRLIAILSGVLTGVIQALLPAIVTLVQALGPVLGAVITALVPLVSLVAKTLGTVLGALMPLIDTVISVVAAFAPLIAQLLPALLSLLTPVINLLTALLTPILALITPILNLLVPALQFVATVLSVVIGWIVQAITWFVKLITGNKQAGDQFMAVWNAIMGFFGGIGKFFADIWNGIINGISGFIVKVVGFFQSIPKTIQNIFAGAGLWLYNVGKNLIDGLINGARSILVNIGQFFLNIVPDWIKGPFMAALGIHSPSRVFHEFGVNTIQGYVEGLASQQSKVQSAAEDVARLSVNGASTATSGLARVGAAVGSAGSGTVWNLNGITLEDTAAQLAEQIEKRRRRAARPYMAVVGAG